MELSKNKRYWFGIFLVLIGAILLLDNLYIFPFYLPYYFFSWQSILIVIGLYLLLVKEKREKGLIVIIIGIVFLLPEIFNISTRRMFEFWPVILILAGIGILLRKTGGRHIRSEDADRVEYLDEINIFSGKKTIITNRNFKGGNVTSVFGGAEIDFSRADLGEKIVVLDSFTLFGSFKIIVPPDWTLKLEISCLFGGFSDDRRTSSVEVVTNPDKVLILKGVAIFGGGEVKSY